MHAVTVKLGAQANSAQPQFFRGAAFVPFQAGEGFAQNTRLHRLDAVLQGAFSGQKYSLARVGAGGDGGVRLKDVAGDQLWSQVRFLAEDQHSGQLILKLRQIAGPVVVSKEFEGEIGEPFDRFGMLCRQIAEHMAGQDLQVVKPCAQWWNGEFGGRQGIEEIGSETTFRQCRCKIAMAAHNETGVGCQLLSPANGLKAALVRGNRESAGLGGHISTYASASTLYEVCFNHFFRGKDHPSGGDLIFFQGHGSPGIYARAFLEGRFSEQHLRNFRRELKGEGGLPSYPHPWLLPGFWEAPSVSMGLGPIMAIYQARFNRYLQHRGLLEREGEPHVWAFLGDGETDEPEALGALGVAAREHLDNLTFVINCNLQRLDGPVRGNAQIVRELEGSFRGAGWNVVKVLWSSDWDDLFARDEEGALAERLSQIEDGWLQKYVRSDGKWIREHLANGDPRITELLAPLSDEQVKGLRRGGHDRKKVYNALKAATEHRGQPTVVLCHTVKGYGLGDAGAGTMATHQKKTLDDPDIQIFRERWNVPLSEQAAAELQFAKPEEGAEELGYLQARRKELGGFVPQRKVDCPALQAPAAEDFAKFDAGTKGRAVSTTMAFVDILRGLLKDKELGKYIVPIIPDEARTFGMEGLFRQHGIYSSVGQRYEPVDRDSIAYYKEAKDGQVLEEGITEAGATSSLIAAGTAYATHGIPTIPFYIFYSMFGLQRIGDLAFAGADMRARGFFIGATAGRTTLNGEGLQHQDGHSHLLAYGIPTLVCYDPCYAYELATIIRDGIRRMYQEGENVLYYITVENENYEHPELPDESVREGILKGMYRLRAGTTKGKDGKEGELRAQLFGSGPIMPQVLKAQVVLGERYGVRADVWSVTSYKELRRDALSADRHNLLNPESEPQVPYVTQVLEGAEGVKVAASDYVKALPDSIAPWVPGGLRALGTDGFGRSETRESLRNFFEVDWRFVTLATLAELARAGQIERSRVKVALQDLEIDPAKLDPMIS